MNIVKTLPIITLEKKTIKNGYRLSLLNYFELFVLTSIAKQFMLL